MTRLLMFISVSFSLDAAAHFKDRRPDHKGLWTIYRNVEMRSWARAEQQHKPPTSAAIATAWSALVLWGSPTQRQKSISSTATWQQRYTRFIICGKIVWNRHTHKHHIIENYLCGEYRVKLKLCKRTEICTFCKCWAFQSNCNSRASQMYDWARSV